MFGLGTPGPQGRQYLRNETMGSNHVLGHSLDDAIQADLREIDGHLISDLRRAESLKRLCCLAEDGIMYLPKRQTALMSA
jgi:hypothetical protein